MKMFYGILVVVAVVVVGWYFFRPMPFSVSPSPLMTAAPITTDKTGIKVFNVTGANFRFDPAVITINQGDKVKIVFKPLDMQHDFDITELGVDSPVTVAGETSEFEFTAGKSGEFEYFCSVGRHRANGMVGKLIVL